jgi:hypothetical protein
MSIQIKRSFLNLYDRETLNNEFSITHSLNQVAIKSLVPILFHQEVKLKHTIGDIDNVAQKLHDMDAAAHAASLANEALVTGVSNNLASNISTLNKTIGTIQSGLINEIAQRSAGQSVDAHARTVNLAVSSSAIDSEAVTARAAELRNQIAIKALATTLTTRLTNEINNRIESISSINTQVEFIKNNVDPSAIDSISELLTKLGNEDQSTLTIITKLQARVKSLELVVNQLTNDQTPVLSLFKSVTSMNNLDTTTANSITSESTLVNKWPSSTIFNYYKIGGVIWFDATGNGNANSYTSEAHFNDENFPSLLSN